MFGLCDKTKAGGGKLWGRMKKKRTKRPCRNKSASSQRSCEARQVFTVSEIDGGSRRGADMSVVQQDGDRWRWSTFR